MSATPTAYDNFAYSNFPYVETHPRHLAALADLYGMHPVPVSGCRVLELGCGAGGNLLPMAYQYPGSEFVGVDLSARAVEQGSNDIAALGLTNIMLRHADIAEVTAGYGRFDYVIAHGVYSWVPAEVREKMLAIFHANLNPQGVAYVSYNAYPDGHLRNLVRDLMFFHVCGSDRPEDQVAQARAILKTMADASDENTLQGMILREQYSRIERKRDAALFHDELNEIATPFLLHRVVADAARHGLQYLCDAELWGRWFNPLPEQLSALNDDFSAEAYVARDQYLDFIEDTGFRRTLLCQSGVPLERDVRPARMKRYHFSSSIAPVDANADVLANGIVQFTTPAGRTLKTDHRLTKAALLHLGRSWPAAIAFADLAERTREQLASRADAGDATSDQQVETLTETLFRMVRAGHIHIDVFPPSFVTKVSERPRASRLARHQAVSTGMMTGLRHNVAALDDAILRQFVGLVDGTRTLDQLVVDLEASATQANVAAKDGVFTRQTVEQALNVIARLALLEA